MQRTVSDKISQLVTECVYRIATGAWPPNGRLPSHRRAAEMWQVDPMTVKRAYHRLEERGLVRSVSKSGVFVCDSAAVLDLRRYGPVLEALYREWRERIIDETDISVLGAFRYLSYLAEADAADNPECAFVECTRVQSDQLAGEVTRTLGVPCRSIVLDDLLRDPAASCVGLRTVFTTGFHIDEVAHTCLPSHLPVLQTTVRFAGTRASEITAAGGDFLVLSLDAAQGRLIAQEIAERAGMADAAPRARRADPDIAEREVSRALADTSQPVVASPTIWSALPNDLRADPRVFGYAFEFDPDTQEYMARAIGLPVHTPLRAGAES